MKEISFNNFTGRTLIKLCNNFLDKKQGIEIIIRNNIRYYYTESIQNIKIENEKFD